MNTVKPCWYIEYSFEPDRSVNHTVKDIFTSKEDAVQCAYRAAESAVDDMSEMDEGPYNVVQDAGPVKDGFQVYVTERKRQTDTWTIKQGVLHS